MVSSASKSGSIAATHLRTPSPVRSAVRVVMTVVAARHVVVSAQVAAILQVLPQLLHLHPPQKHLHQQLSNFQFTPFS